MLVPSTFTGWYRKMMMKAEMARETSRSRAQTAITGRERGKGSVLAGTVTGWEFPTSDIVCLSYRKGLQRGEPIGKLHKKKEEATYQTAPLRFK